MCGERQVIGSGHAQGRTNSVTLVPHGGAAGNLAPLRTRDGRRDLILEIRHHYTVVRLPDDGVPEPYQIRATYYFYGILDRDRREIVVYQWHPEGVSDITFPHLHIPRIAPIPLAQTDPRTVAVGEMHLPTNRVLLEDVVELLIREFAVAPQRADWQALLNENRAAFQHGRTW